MNNELSFCYLLIFLSLEVVDQRNSDKRVRAASAILWDLNDETVWLTFSDPGERLACSWPTFPVVVIVVSASQRN